MDRRLKKLNRSRERFNRLYLAYRKNPREDGEVSDVPPKRQRNMASEKGPCWNNKKSIRIG